MPLERFSRGRPPPFGHLDIPDASPEKFGDSNSRVDTIPMGHASVAARLSIYAAFDPEAAGVSTTATGFHPAPLTLWSCPGPPFPSPSPAPRVRAVRGLPGIFPAAPLGLGLGQSLGQEGAGVMECMFLQELTKAACALHRRLWTSGHSRCIV